MLRVVPASWVSSMLHWPCATKRYVEFCATADGTAYTFEYKPQAGPMDKMGNRPCDHYQPHGDAMLDDVSKMSMVAGTKVADYVGYGYWWPKVTNVRAYNYGWTTLPVALFVYPGCNNDLVYDYVRSTNPGVVLKGVSSPFRFSYRTCPKDQLFAVDLYGYNTPNSTTVGKAASCTWSMYLAGGRYDAAKKQWYLLKLPSSITFVPSNGAFSSMTISPFSAYSSYTSKSVTVKLQPPSGMSCNDYLIANPLALSNLADELIAFLVRYAEQAGFVDGSTYALSRTYIPEWAYHTNLKPKFLKSSELARIKDGLLDRISQSETIPIYGKRALLGDATVSAADAAKRFQGNMIAYVKEAVVLKETILDTIKLFRGGLNPKTISNLWLSYRYGLRLTARDTNDLISAVKQEITTLGQSYFTARGGSQSDDFVAHCKLYYSPSEQSDWIAWIEKLYSWDLLPTLENVWDLIPYSFVIDWFVNVSDLLNGLDSIGYTKTMHIFSTCYSVKHTWQPEHLWLTARVVGNIYCTHYTRENPVEPYQYVPHLTGSLPSLQNIVDGSSLIIQRT